MSLVRLPLLWSTASSSCLLGALLHSRLIHSVSCPLHWIICTLTASWSPEASDACWIFPSCWLLLFRLVWCILLALAGHWPLLVAHPLEVFLKSLFIHTPRGWILLIQAARVTATVTFFFQSSVLLRLQSYVLRMCLTSAAFLWTFHFLDLSSSWAWHLFIPLVELLPRHHRQG